jgi:hypothetical protein
VAEAVGGGGSWGEGQRRLRKLYHLLLPAASKKTHTAVKKIDVVNLHIMGRVVELLDPQPRPDRFAPLLGDD